jgi:spore photoproduct lyase
MMANPPLKRVLVEEGADLFPPTSRILKRTEGIPVERVTDREKGQETGPLYMDKTSLRLISFPGEFLKPCPGTKGYICCGYQILNIGTNCPFDCSYCILQAYFNQPSIEFSG